MSTPSGPPGVSMVDTKLAKSGSHGTMTGSVAAGRDTADLVFDNSPAHSTDESASQPAGKKVKQETVSVGQLFRFATTRDWLSMLVAALGAGVVGAAQPGMMILFADLMNAAGGLADANQTLSDSFNDIAIKMAALGAICLVGAWIGDAGFKTSGLRQSAMWRKHYLKAILSQDIGWYDTNNPGELSSRIAESTQQIEEGVSTKLTSLCRNTMQGLFGLGIAFWYAWDVALVLLAVSPIVMFGAWFMTKTTTEAAGDMANAYAKAGGTASETLSELRTVSAMNAEHMQADKYSVNLESARRADVRKSYRVGFANGLMFSSGNFMAGVGFIYGSIKIAKELENTTKMVTIGDLEYETNCADQGAVAAGVMDACGINGGDVLVALFALQMGAQGLGLIEPSLTALAKAKAAAFNILKVVDRMLTIDSFTDQGLKPDKIAGTITFENVHFAYPSRPDQKVADGYSLTVEAGTTVALVGASGSGKSTAIQLVERFYDPNSGVVKLDGTDLKKLNVRWLRQQIGLVGQEPVLFSGTIAENIAHGKEGATREEVVAAAKMSNAHDFILTFPQGYDTDVGEKGGQLSGGQKQRIAIARAMIKQPSVLLLDEATSALDNESERVVQAALDDLLRKQKRTTIVIAHRLSTIRNADKIVVVEKGRIVEQGTHDQLMARGEAGYFYRLNRKQAGDQQNSAGVMAVSNHGVNMHGMAARMPSAKRTPSDGVARIPSAGDVERTKSAEEVKADKAESKKAVSRVWSMHSGDNFHFFIGTIGALLVGGANPAVGIIFVKSLFNFYGDDPDKMRTEGYLWAGAMMGVAVCQVLGDTARGWGFGVPGAKLTKKLREMYFAALMRQEIGWHDLPDNASASLCANLATEINTVQALSGEGMGRNVLTLCTVVVAFTFAFVFGYWAMALVAIAVIPIMVSGMAIEIALLTGAGSNGGSMGEEAARVVGEAVSSIRTISSFTLEVLFVNKFYDSIDAFLNTSIVKAVRNGFFAGYSQGSLFGAFALLYWFGGQELSAGRTDFEGMFIPIFCMFMLGAGLGQASQGATDAGKAAEAAKRVFELIDREPAIDASSEQGLKPSAVTGTITFENVHFAYPSRPDQKVADGYSLTVEAGTTVALVGASGSGKSTAIQLVERFYDPDQGVVKMDGTDLKKLNVHWLRQQIGLVGQEPVLFSGTIAENIAHGKEGATREEVVAAAKMSNAHDFILTFPQGYDTDVGEKGGQLSGGQKQRIAIARAMIKQPSVLLLDEATSALDNESERVVQAALDDLLRKQKRTTIVIAHRLSTIRNADKIAVVEKGRIVEQGTHDQLMARGGKYFALAQSHGMTVSQAPVQQNIPMYGVRY